MSDYNSLKETIQKLVNYPLEEWRITELSAENALKALHKYESEGHTPPTFFIEDRGVTLVWRERNIKKYHHFYPDEDEDEIFISKL